MTPDFRPPAIPLFRFAVLLLIFLIFTCTSLLAQNLMLSPGLDHATELRVKGRQGWQFNQIIRFGDFNTSKVKRGWTKGYDIGFTLRFRKASEKLSFVQMSPDGRQAEVLAVSRFKSTEYELLRNFLSVPLSGEYTFAGTILPADTAAASWDFVVYNPEGSFDDFAECGRAEDQHGRSIVIRAIRQLQGQPSWMAGANYGFEFVRDGEAVAAVSTMNNGKVWMNEALDGEYRLVIAALSSALLLRHDMSDAISLR